ncbi:MAG: hypothetical protein ACI92E_000599 [Oceanicoccus sp.]|jgi:hypothetical protein
MQPSDNVVDFQNFQRVSRQNDIDDIGARAFLFIRDCAEEMELPIKDVIIEHILGLSKVMAAVEGREEVQLVLGKISELLKDA